MARDIPDDVDQAKSFLADVAAELDLAIEGRGRAFLGEVLRVTGRVDGVHVVADVTIDSSMGAAHYDMVVTATVEPSLGFGLRLAPGGLPLPRSRGHLPPAWEGHPETTHLVGVESEDPHAVQAILAEVEVPTFVIPQDGASTGFTEVADDRVSMRVGKLGRARELTENLRATARWTATLAAAGEAYAPTDHAVMRAASWRPVQQAHGGELDFRDRRFRLATPTTTLDVQARYGAHTGHQLFGELQWPALPFDELSLTPQGERSWLRRLFMRDVVIGRDDVDRAFLIDAEPRSRLEELVTERVARASLQLLELTRGLTIRRDGATFLVVDAKLSPEQALELVAAAIELGHAVTDAFFERQGAYR